MPRTRRYIFNTLTVVSLLLLLATVGLILRDQVFRDHFISSSTSWESQSEKLWVELGTSPSGLFVTVHTELGNPPRIIPDRDYGILGFRYSSGLDLGSSRFTAIAVPYWFLILTLAIAPIYWWRKKRMQLKRVGKCPSCGYDLTGNESGVCPECGKTIGTKATQT